MSDMEITIPHEIFATKLCLCAHDLRHDFVQKSDRVQLSLSGINEPFPPLEGGGNSSLLHPQDYVEHTLYSSTDNNMAVLIAEHFYKETLNELFTSKNTSDIVAQKVEEKMSEFKKTLDAYDPMVSESRRPATPEIAEEQDTTDGIERQSTTVGPAPVRFERQSTTVGAQSQSVPGTPEGFKKRKGQGTTVKSDNRKQATPETPVETATTPERLQPTKRQRSEQVVGRSTGMAGGAAGEINAESMANLEAFVQRTDIPSISNVISGVGDEGVTSLGATFNGFVEKRRSTRRPQKTSMFGDFVSSDIDFGKIEKWNEAYETYILLLRIQYPDKAVDMIENMNIYIQQNSDEMNKIKQKAFIDFLEILRTVFTQNDWPDHKKVKISTAIWTSYKNYGDNLSEKWNNFIFNGSSPRGDRGPSPVFDLPDESRKSLIDIFKLEKLNTIFKKARRSLGNQGDTVIWKAYQGLFEGEDIKPYNCVISGQRMAQPPVGLTSEALFSISGSDNSIVNKLINNCAMIDGNHQFFRSPTLTNFKGTPNLFSFIDPMPILNNPPPGNDAKTIKVKTDGGEISITLNYTQKDNEVKVTLGFTFEWHGTIIERQGIDLDFTRGQQPLSVSNCITRWVNFIKSDGSLGDIGLFTGRDRGEYEILSLFMIKLIGDLGQEIYAACNDSIFFANDRPSAIRYMLLKLFAKKGGERILTKSGGGGYLSAALYTLIKSTQIPTPMGGGGRIRHIKGRKYKHRKFSVKKTRTLSDKEYKKYKAYRKYRRSLRKLRSKRRSRRSKRRSRRR